MHYLEEGELKAKNRLMRKLNGIPNPNSTEALMGFIAWLTCRDIPVTLSGKDTTYDIMELYKKYIIVNSLPEVRGGIHPKCLEFPKE